MASDPTISPTSVFVDSSVLIAAAISARGSARELLLQGLRGQRKLFLSPLVLDETERNLIRKAPAALPTFEVFRQALPAQHGDPPKSLVLRVARVVELKDAPIVAAALRARAHQVATYDRKHLLSQREQIQTPFGIIVATPDEILAT